MLNANWSLQKAIYELLSTDPSVLNILGAPRIYDHVPRNAGYPHVVFGEGRSRDWSTATEDGDEHVVTMRVWSEGSGKRENAEIIAVIRSVLNASELTVDGHHLVNLRHEASEIQRHGDGDVWRGLIRYRAVTEPVAA